MNFVYTGDFPFVTETLHYPMYPKNTKPRQEKTQGLALD